MYISFFSSSFGNIFSIQWNLFFLLSSAYNSRLEREEEEEVREKKLKREMKTAMNKVLCVCVLLLLGTFQGTG